uniref:Uncharacterized protein n=1 Tax=Anguilla anguilla TaxID=7936 RepID=A0A0E9RU02_ANGAN
MCARESACACL